jgi:hypothetical protein
LEAIPEPLQQAFLEQVKQQSLADQAQLQEPDAARALGYRAGQGAMLDLLRAIVRDGKRLTLGWKLGQAPAGAVVALEIAAKPGSSFAKALGDLKPSGFQGAIRSNLLASGAFSIPIPESFVGVIAASMAEARAATQQGKEPPSARAKAEKEITERLMKLVEEELKEGRLDFCVAVDAQTPDQLEMQALVRLKGAEAFGQAFIDAITKAPGPGDEKIVLHSAKHGGFDMHLIPIDGANPFGLGAEMTFGFSKDAACLAMGVKSQSKLKEFLDRSTGRRADDGPAPIIVARMSLARVLRLAGPSGVAAIDEFAKSNPNDGDGVELWMENRVKGRPEAASSSPDLRILVRFENKVVGLFAQAVVEGIREQGLEGLRNLPAPAR